MPARAPAVEEGDGESAQPADDDEADQRPEDASGVEDAVAPEGELGRVSAAVVADEGQADRAADESADQPGGEDRHDEERAEDARARVQCWLHGSTSLP